MLHDSGTMGLPELEYLVTVDFLQVVKVMGTGGFKWQWLVSRLVEFMSEGSVLIFVTKKQNCDELAQNLKVKEFDVRCIHGDLAQHERNTIIHSFKKKEFPILGCDPNSCFS